MKNKIPKQLYFEKENLEKLQLEAQKRNMTTNGLIMSKIFQEENEK